MQKEIMLDAIMAQAIKRGLSFWQAKQRVEAYFSCIDFDYSNQLNEWEKIYNEKYVQEMYK